MEAAASIDPDHVHIATESPLGWIARAIMKRRGWQFRGVLVERCHAAVPGRLRPLVAAA